ncbi:hypothetical protein [Polymorphobacter fuscus]|uniref:DUF2946 domain-containing protein n=1 Tax=Sandarakinorhabdus fusca TaxID=1439888 RepID=A0A7C9GQD3_9SPHN|nr:hypothetical protein [Polymorphobacter fuscus]KAB7646346.1 hypothetical protein F9290_09895 [Polymorphobacter fuscus]MQT17573.1 hypothetical protein [Polymorphobacter fuscus]NJC09884.1 hypothetical protein [Polymorphobacter fuscus]
MTRRAPFASLAFSLGLCAALLALCLRLMAPVGWMPVASGNGVIFTLCSGIGSEMPDVGTSGSPDTAEAHQAPCAFSGIGTPALPDLPPDVALAVFLVFIALGLAAVPRLHILAVGWLRPPLRGPPSRV